MRLYHGSTVDIQQIDLCKSKLNKDFGRAFYLSADEQQALEMAQSPSNMLSARRRLLTNSSR